MDLEQEDLKLLCPDGTEANLDEFEHCHLAAVPANAVVVRVEDKCRVWKFLERLQVCVCVRKQIESAVYMCVILQICVCVCLISLWSLCYRSARLRAQVSASLSSFFLP